MVIAIAPLATAAGNVGSDAFAAAIGDFYMTNPIARASAIMAEPSAMKAGRPRAEAAE